MDLTRRVGIIQNNRFQSPKSVGNTALFGLFFTGYKLATSGRFFVAIVFCGHHIKLSGLFGYDQ